MNKDIMLRDYVLIHGRKCCPYCGYKLDYHFEIEEYSKYEWYTCGCDYAQLIPQIEEIDKKIETLEKQKQKLQEQLDIREEITNARAVIEKYKDTDRYLWEDRIEII